MSYGPDLHIEMTCPSCGGDLDLVVEGRSRGAEHASIWRCSECRVEWSLRADLVRVSTEIGPRRSPQGSGCATDAGYRAHLRRGEAPCAPCKAAHAAGQAAYVSRRSRARAGTLV